MSKNQSPATMKKVYDRWKGRCAFCSIQGTIEQHHIVAKNEDPSLIDDPDNLVLLCANHHTLTLKKNPNGKAVISFIEIQDIANSKYVNSGKQGFYFDIPQNHKVILGSNICINYPYILVVNKKPLIELWAKKPVHYTATSGFFLTLRFFDESNNFLGGMFDNHWAYIFNEDWEINLNPNEIDIKHTSKDFFIKIEKKDSLYITGTFYFDGIRIEARENEMVIPGNNKLIGNTLECCAFSIFGDKNQSSFGIGGVKL